MPIWGSGNFWGNKQQPKIYHPEPEDEETSQHLFDPFTFDHVTMGLFSYMTFPLGGSTIPDHVHNSLFDKWRNNDMSNNEHSCYFWFSINLCLYILFEFVENLPFVIKGIRTTDVDPNNIGDSVINSVGDIMGCSFGYWLGYFIYNYNENFFTYHNLFYYFGLCIIVQIISTYLGAGMFRMLGRYIRNQYKKLTK